MPPSSCRLAKWLAPRISAWPGAPAAGTVGEPERFAEAAGKLLGIGGWEAELRRRRRRSPESVERGRAGSVGGAGELSSKRPASGAGCGSEDVWSERWGEMRPSRESSRCMICCSQSETGAVAESARSGASGAAEGGIGAAAGGVGCCWALGAAAGIGWAAGSAIRRRKNIINKLPRG